MQGRLVSLLLLAGSLTLALPLSTFAQGSGIEVVARFNAQAGELPEGMALDSQGNAYMSMQRLGQIRKVTPSGQVSTYATLPLGEGGGATLGVLFDARGNLYAATATMSGDTNGIWRVRPDGTVERFAALSPQAAPFPNGLAFRGDDLYVAESRAGKIWRITPQGQPSEWASDPLLEGRAAMPGGNPIGANGIAFGGNAAFVANTNLGRIIRVPVNADGSAGKAETYVENLDFLGGADGVDVDSAGAVYVAVNQRNRIAVVLPDRTIGIVADSGPLQTPSSLTLRGDQVYIVNFAAAFAMRPDANPALLRMPKPTLPPAASDGRSLWGEPAATQALFVATHGLTAGARWASEHDAALRR
jgi:sugar lactone lactonase YvrE